MKLFKCYKLSTLLILDALSQETGASLTEYSISFLGGRLYIMLKLYY